MTEKKLVTSVLIWETGKPWVPVQDWMKEGKKFSPDQLRAFARHFYEAGRSAGKNEVWENKETIVKIS